MLRRRLQEVTAAQWSDAVLNAHLNSGLSYMEDKILAIDPYAFVYTDTTPTAASQSDYAKPLGFRYEVALFLSTDGGTTYSKPLELRPLYEMQESIDSAGNEIATTGLNSDVTFAHKGRFFRLFPTPSQVGVLKLEWVPTLTMGSDSDVPDLALGLHDGIVFRAEMLALGETSQEAQLAAAELEIILKALPMHYRASGRPQYIEPSYGKWNTE
jgi:hypothetical protein